MATEKYSLYSLERLQYLYDFLWGFTVCGKSINHVSLRILIEMEGFLDQLLKWALKYWTNFQSFAKKTNLYVDK